MVWPTSTPSESAPPTKSLQPLIQMLRLWIVTVHSLMKIIKEWTKTIRPLTSAMPVLMIITQPLTKIIKG